MNKVILIGRLVKDPDLKFTANKGIAVSNFTLAVTRPFKKDETDFINCRAFGKSAELIAQYMTKGRQLAVTGRIQNSSYDKEGEKKYVTNIIVDAFEFIGNSNVTSNNDSSQEGINISEDMTLVADADTPF